jgi:hypothetical protein
VLNVNNSVEKQSGHLDAYSCPAEATNLFRVLEPRTSRPLVHRLHNENLWHNPLRD